MKRYWIILIALVVVFTAGIVVAADYTFKEQVIKVEQKKDYLEITIVNKQFKEPMVYRVYPCGEVQMQEWKQLTPNKEQGQPFRYQPGDNNVIYTITPNPTTLQYDASTPELRLDSKTFH